MKTNLSKTFLGNKVNQSCNWTFIKIWYLETCGYLTDLLNPIYLKGQLPPEMSQTLYTILNLWK